MAKEKQSAWDVEPAENLQKIPAELDKKVGDKYRNDDIAPAMVSENDRKTGVISKTANESLQGMAYKPNK